jgi:putative membrane protein
MKLQFFKAVYENKEDIILRDYLALERTRLANERTLLSYTRASLYMILGGITFLQLQDFREIRWIGYVTLASSVVIILIGIYRFFLINLRLKKLYDTPKA